MEVKQLHAGGGFKCKSCFLSLANKTKTRPCARPPTRTEEHELAVPWFQVTSDAFIYVIKETVGFSQAV